MKSFKLSVGIILVLFLLDKVIYFSLLTIDKKVLTGEGIGKINHFNLVKDTTEYIVFGNSRANHHINPEVFGKSAFNIGVGGRKMAFSATLIQMLPKLKKQYVLLQIDPEYVFDTNYDGSDIDALYVKYHQNEIIKNKIDDLNRNNAFSIFFWSLDYNRKLFSLLINRFRPKYDFKKYKGYDPIENNSQQKQMFLKRLKNLDKKDKCSNIYEASKLERKYLKEIKDFCTKNNKVLVLFTSPVYKDKCKSDNKEMKILMKNFGIKYYDYSDYFSNDDNIDNWKDESHLSKKGADKFSIFIASSLKKDIN
jgi:hypothetical protein